MATVTRDNQKDRESLASFAFCLYLSGPGNLDFDRLEAAVFQCGCDDALLGVRSGQVFLDFDRQAESLHEAIRSAIWDVEQSDIGLQVDRVVPLGDDVIRRFNSILELRHDKVASIVREKATEMLQDLLRK